MNSKKMVIATFSLLLSALLIMGAINFAIDPLFQYHKPWFGLKANIIDSRYQNAGIAKNFEFLLWRCKNGYRYPGVRPKKTFFKTL